MVKLILSDSTKFYQNNLNFGILMQKEKGKLKHLRTSDYANATPQILYTSFSVVYCGVYFAYIVEVSWNPLCLVKT